MIMNPVNLILKMKLFSSIFVVSSSLTIFFFLLLSVSNLEDVYVMAESNSKNISDSYSLYQNKALGLSFQYPKQWDIQESQTADKFSITLFPPYVNKKQSNDNDITISLENINQNVSLTGYLNDMEVIYNTILNNMSEIIRSPILLLGDIPAYMLSFNSSDSGGPINNMHVLTITNNTLLNIVYQSDPKSYSDHLTDINLIIQSINIIRQNNTNLLDFGVTGSDDVDIKIGCNYETQSFNSKIWKFDYEVVSQKGLVLKNIMAGNQKVFDSIIIPHFKIQDRYSSKIIRYCDSSDPKAEWFSIKPTPITNLEGNDYLHWSFGVKYDNDYGLVVNYDIVIGKETRNDCEANASSCYRFIPKVSFSYPHTLEKFTAFYKLDLGSDVGLSVIRDIDVTLSSITNDPGRHPMLTNEFGFLAVKNGEAGEYDNMHTAHPTQSISIPGCRAGIFDCSHIHWRLSDVEKTKLVDPMVEPSTGGSLVNPTLSKETIDALDESLRGKPNLVPGQTISIAIVNYHPEEDDPDDPSILLNNETLATAEGVKVPNMNKLGQVTYQEQCPKCYLKTGGHPVVWYVASVDNKDSNTFFRHGFFVLDTLSSKNNIDNKITFDKLH